MEVRAADISIGVSDTQQGLKEWESNSPPSPPGMGWSQRPHSFCCHWVSQQDGSSVLGPQGSSTPSAKATNWHKKVWFSSCWMLHKTMFQTIGRFSFLRNPFSSHWPQHNPARTLQLGIWDTQHPELLSWLCHPPAVTLKTSHFSLHAFILFPEFLLTQLSPLEQRFDSAVVPGSSASTRI